MSGQAAAFHPAPADAGPDHPRPLLRHFEPQDLEPLAALYADPQMRRHYPDGTRTFDETRLELEWFQHGHPRLPQLGLWATVERGSGQFLGRCGLWPWRGGAQGRHGVRAHLQ